MPPGRIGSVLATFEKTISANNEAGVTSGMYLSSLAKNPHKGPQASGPKIKMEMKPRVACRPNSKHCPSADDDESQSQSTVTSFRGNKTLNFPDKRKSLSADDDQSQSQSTVTSFRGNKTLNFPDKRKSLSADDDQSQSQSTVATLKGHKTLNFPDKRKTAEGETSVGTAETATTLTSMESSEVGRSWRNKTRVNRSTGLAKKLEEHASTKIESSKSDGEESLDASQVFDINLVEGGGEKRQKSQRKINTRPLSNKTNKKSIATVKRNEDAELSDGSLEASDVFNFTDEEFEDTTFDDDMNCSFTSNNSNGHRSTALDDFNASFSLINENQKGHSRRAKRNDGEASAASCTEKSSRRPSNKSSTSKQASAETGKGKSIGRSKSEGDKKMGERRTKSKASLQKRLENSFHASAQSLLDSASDFHFEVETDDDSFAFEDSKRVTSVVKTPLVDSSTNFDFDFEHDNIEFPDEAMPISKPLRKTSRPVNKSQSLLETRKSGSRPRKERSPSRPVNTGKSPPRSSQSPSRQRKERSPSRRSKTAPRSTTGSSPSRRAMASKTIPKSSESSPPADATPNNTIPNRSSESSHSTIGLVDKNQLNSVSKVKQMFDTKSECDLMRVSRHVVSTSNESTQANPRPRRTSASQSETGPQEQPPTRSRRSLAETLERKRPGDDKKSSRSGNASINSRRSSAKSKADDLSVYTESSYQSSFSESLRSCKLRGDDSSSVLAPKLAPSGKDNDVARSRRRNTLEEKKEPERVEPVRKIKLRQAAANRKSTGRKRRTRLSASSGTGLESGSELESEDDSCVESESEAGGANCYSKQYF